MKNLKVGSYQLGTNGTNCYMIYRNTRAAEAPEPCIIVDPADNASFIVKKCRELNVKPEAILLTHGHFDHILAAEDVRRAFHVPICAGENEQELLKNSHWNLTWEFGAGMSLTADRWLRDGETLHLAGTDWKVLFTPGHTEGSVCYYAPDEDLLISGDTLFNESVGRTDLPTGDAEKLYISVTEKLFSLPEETTVYPGHGYRTSIGYEKKNNTYIR